MRKYLITDARAVSRRQPMLWLGLFLLVLGAWAQYVAPVLITVGTLMIATSLLKHYWRR